MAEASIPVDLFNPGQVFASLGFLEAADILVGDAEGGFDWRDERNVMFALRASGDWNPFEIVLKFLKTAGMRWLSPDPVIKERDGGYTIIEPGVSSSSKPKSPDLPAILQGTYNGEECVIPVGFWADGSARFATTFKKSTNGASSYIRFKNALDFIQNLDPTPASADPFDKRARTESLFRLDPRGSVDPINGGTSPDLLRKGGIKMRVATYPICEALAVIGLEHARPERCGPMRFRYHAWGNLRSDACSHPVLLSPVLARGALSGLFPFLEMRRFVVDHEEVKRGGDRKMTDIREEILT